VPCIRKEGEAAVSQEKVEVAPVAIDATTVRIPAIHHVNLKTTRLQELVDWYGVVVGSKPNFQFPGGAFLSNDAANHRIALIALPVFDDDADRVTHTGVHHVAFEYDSLDDLLSTYLRLKKEGITPGGCLDHGLTMSFYYFDPDNNGVELQADNYGDWSESTRFIREDPRFAADPIGKPVDPEALVEARRSGLSPWEVHERAYEGAYPPSDGFDIRFPLPQE
jgi:catechol-2,3-dioxygenase